MRNIVVVIGSQFYARPFRSFGSVSFKVDKLFQNPNKVRLAVFSGGEDVDPSLYGGIDKGISQTNPKRDAFERAIFNQCRHNSIPMVGICRGFQFLNVMANGKMFQHLEGHGLWGRHPAFFPATNSTMLVSSTHHQLVKLPDNAVPITWAEPRRSRFYFGPDAVMTADPQPEIEGAVFSDINAMGVQYHPDMMYESEPGFQFFVKVVGDFLKIPIKEFEEMHRRNLNAERAKRAQA